MEQQRWTILNLYFNWTIFFAGATFLLITERYLLLAVWLIGAPILQVACVIAFARLSQALGYGSATDEDASLEHQP